MGPDRPSPAVVLCGELGRAGPTDVDALAERLRARLPRMTVSVVADACGDGAALRAALAGADRAVLGLCRPPDRGRLQGVARSAGIDPLAVETVALDGAPSEAWAARRLAAAVARSRRYRGSRPENVVPRVPRKRTRRALLSLGPITYEVVPAIDPKACAVRGGCTICARACPIGAITRVDGRLDLDRSRCSGCAVCVAACPREAITLPTFSGERLRAEIAALLDTADGDASPRTIAFVCRSVAGASEGAEAGWLPVEVPCLGALSPDWPLRCLVAGASGVVLAGCDTCPASADVRRGAAWCTALLGRAGLGERVRLEPTAERAADQSETAAGRPAQVRVTPPSCASTIVALLGARGADALDDLAHPGSPFGMVSIRADACTLCGSCATACPAAALEWRASADEVSLTFDHARCVGCGLCASACPEGPGVLTVERVTRPRALSRRRTPLYRDAQARCVSCGQAIAPRRLLARVTSLLSDQPRVAAVLERYCTDCRDRSGRAIG